MAQLLPWPPSCVPPASLYLPEGGTQDGGPGQEEGEQDMGPHPPHFLSSEFRPHRRRGFLLHHYNPPVLGGLIPEESVARPSQGESESVRAMGTPITIEKAWVLENDVGTDA